jgi:hypothetical protein
MKLWVCKGCGEQLGFLHRLWCKYIKSHYDCVQKDQLEKVDL